MRIIIEFQLSTKKIL